MTRIMWTLRGLFEPLGGARNMLNTYATPFQLAGWEVSEFETWPARFGDYDAALEKCARELAQSIMNSGPGVEIALVGYSGGSHVIKRALALLDPAHHHKVVLVTLVADPSFPSTLQTQDRLVGSALDFSSGIAGPMEVDIECGITYITDRGDPICCTPKGSPLHVLAAALTTMSPDVSRIPARYRAKLLTAGLVRRDPYAYRQALSLLFAYAFLGVHQRPYPALMTRVAAKQLSS